MRYALRDYWIKCLYYVSACGATMKRDWELIRVILTKLEEMGTSNGSLDANKVENHEAENVSYHMCTLDEAGLIEATCVKSISGPMQCFACRLT
jgi:Hypothetical protein (DUF2513)